MPKSNAAIAEGMTAPASRSEPSANQIHAPANLGVALTAFAIAEAALAFAHGVFGWGFLVVLLLHAGIVAGAAAHFITTSTPGHDITPRALIVLAIAIGGPIGALAGWYFARMALHPARPSPLLDEWYRRISLAAEIDPVTELCDNVASGRTMNLASAVPRSFHAIMVAGTVADQQTALGLIARRFHPDYLPALTRALRSPEPVIRVQAAAVVARIRDQLQARVRSRIAELEDAAEPGDHPEALAELAKAVSSGLLDESDRRRAETLVARADQSGAAEQAGVTALRPSPTSYKALRVAHRRRRIARSGDYRVRRLPRPQPRDRRA